jgi:hypothetical protein
MVARSLSSAGRPTTKDCRIDHVCTVHNFNNTPPSAAGTRTRLCLPMDERPYHKKGNRPIVQLHTKNRDRPHTDTPQGERQMSVAQTPQRLHERPDRHGQSLLTTPRVEEEETRLFTTSSIITQQPPNGRYSIFNRSDPRRSKRPQEWRGVRRKPLGKTYILLLTRLVCSRHIRSNNLATKSIIPPQQVNKASQNRSLGPS